MNAPATPLEHSTRLLSLDLFRGMVMFLLIAEGAEVCRALSALVPAESWRGALLVQFTHHPWHGLRFWDLIQPAFMFIVGVAMVYSLRKRFDRGDSWSQTFKHIGLRCFMLFVFGTGLQCFYHGELYWGLWNVLVQLSVTVLITFLIFRWPWKRQLAVAVGLILLTDLAYRFFPLEGFNQPYTPDKNFGSWADMILMGHLSGGHWIAINFIPTAAHTIWGSLVGQLLQSKLTPSKKLQILVISGLGGLVIGYLMNGGFGIEALQVPIIKRICTGSFVYASGGWCLLIFAFFYYLVDIKHWQPSGLLILNVVGMNSIFIYLVLGTMGGSWLRPNVEIFTAGILGKIHVSENWIHLATALTSWFILWYLCYWLYRKKIFIRL